MANYVINTLNSVLDYSPYLTNSVGVYKVTVALSIPVCSKILHSLLFSSAPSLQLNHKRVPGTTASMHMVI